MKDQQILQLVNAAAGILGDCFKEFQAAPGKIKIKTTSFEIETKDAERLVKSLVKSLKSKKSGLSPCPDWVEAGCAGDVLTPEELARTPEENLRAAVTSNLRAAMSSCGYCGVPTTMPSWKDNKGQVWPPCCSKDSCLDEQWLKVESTKGGAATVDVMKAKGSLPKETIKIETLEEKDVEYWRSQVDKEQPEFGF